MQAVLGKVGVGPSKVLHDLSGKTALVTGGAQGIGYEVAKAFSSVNARVIMVNRKEEQGTAAVKAIKDEMGAGANVEWVHCDFGNLKEVQSVFTKIREKEDKLDLLVMAAGIGANKFALTEDGLDRLFEVNWLGQYYATNILYPLIRKTSMMPAASPPRIMMLTSELYRTAPSNIRFESIDEINDEKLGPNELYARSKLAVILGIKYGLFERVIKKNGDNVFAMAIYPGTVKTEMQKQWKEAYPGVTGKLLQLAAGAISRSPEQGAFSTLYAATSPEIEEKQWNGAYILEPGQLGKENSQVNPELGANLWDLSQKIIKQKVGENAFVEWK
ncbi:conserved hypothetical protein [Uncinocarpus reesii 1704]|uniref:NAD(P)-binding protein n=1 Tax=Uncinocarpus reesii (strain UAMH 1704) TaxID=336963 RepID=C4JWV0_UNCRE|nr:uncharacterized protein UREG_06123 [Uncinocarpus reesii 1704]EEP81258.1 conserved hypothetical protein [Uncinocarpus reesii 1704]